MKAFEVLVGFFSVSTKEQVHQIVGSILVIITLITAFFSDVVPMLQQVLNLTGS